MNAITTKRKLIQALKSGRMALHAQIGAQTRYWLAGEGQEIPVSARAVRSAQEAGDLTRERTILTADGQAVLYRLQS